MRPSAVQRAAFDEARQLGHSWVGPEHALLAILRGDADNPARRALDQAGLSAETVEGFIDKLHRAPPGPVQPSPDGRTTPNPAWYVLYGRAEGFASALGTGEMESVHLLLALLWDPEWWLFAEHQDVPRGRVVEALSSLGVVLPRAPLPPLHRIELTQRIDLLYDELDAVISLLLQRHPPSTAPAFGFNHDDAGNAWVVAGEGIDLQAIVTQARHASEP